MTTWHGRLPHPGTRSTGGIAASRVLCVVAMLVCATSAGLHAQDDPVFHVRPFAGFAMPDHVTTVDEVGIVTPDIDTAESASFGVAVGAKLFTPGLRWEAEYAHRTSNVDGDATIMIPAGIPQVGGLALDLPAHVDGDVSMDSVLFNLAYDFNHAGRLSPFVHAGVGYARVNVESLTFTTAFSAPRVPGAENNGMAYSYGAGVAFRVTTGVAVDVLYRRIEYGSVLTDPSPTGLGKDEFDVALGDLSVGVRLSF